MSVNQKIREMRNLSRRGFLLVAMGCFAVFLSCGGKTDKPEADNTIEITDYYNRKTSIRPNPQRVVSLSPGISELIFALGRQASLVGRTDYCTYPEEVKRIKSVGGISDANVEMIIALKPDVVIASSMVNRQTVERISHSGIPVVSLPERKNVEGVYQTINILGRIFCEQSRADSLVRSMQDGIDRIRRQNRGEVRPKVYYVVGFGSSGDYTAGGNTYINEMIELAGGKNIAENARNWSFSKEALFADQPDCIIIRNEDLKTFVNTSPYNKLKAVRENRVFGIESSLMDCQTNRSIEAIEQISRWIHS